VNNIAKALTGLAALGFLVAVVATFTDGIMGVWPETFSRASSNLALIAICLFVGFKDEGS